MMFSKKELADAYKISHAIFEELVVKQGRRDITSIGPGEKVETRKYLWGLIKREVPTGELAIIFGVEEKHPESRMEMDCIIPKHISNMKTDVQATGKFKFLNSLTTDVRPVRPGYSWGNFRITAGTPGVRVKYDPSGQGKPESAKPFTDSNWHVLKYKDGQVGDAILQRGSCDGGKNPAQRVAKFAISLEDPTGGKPVYTDYALAEMETEFMNVLPIIEAKPGPWKDHSPGDKIMWVGRTSGFGRAGISQMHQDVQVDMGDGSYAWFNDTDIFRPACLPGDSGSWIGEDPYPDSTDMSVYNGKTLGTEGKVFAGSTEMGVMIPSRSIQKVYVGIQVDTEGGDLPVPKIENTRLLVSRDGGSEVSFGENPQDDGNGVYTWRDRVTARLIYPGAHVWRIQVKPVGMDWIECPERHTFNAVDGGDDDDDDDDGDGENVTSGHSQAVSPAEGSTVDCSKAVTISAKVTLTVTKP